VYGQARKRSQEVPGIDIGFQVEVGCSDDTHIVAAGVFLANGS